MCVARHAQRTQNKKDTYLCNISGKTWAMKMLFCLQININVFYKFIVSLWVCKVRHTQSTQNNKFAISFQCLLENVKDKVDFLHAEVHEGFLLINTVLIGMVKHSKSSRNSRFAMSLQYLKKEVSDEVHFLYQSVNLKVDFNNLGVKFSYKAILSLLIGMIKHSQSTQSNKFTISLQYREEFIFCMQMNIKVSKSWHYHFGWKSPDMFKVLKNESWLYFCNILRKKCRNCSCALFWCKILRYFTEV